jgi:hypothetical protein
LARVADARAVGAAATGVGAVVTLACVADARTVGAAATVTGTVVALACVARVGTAVALARVRAAMPLARGLSVGLDGGKWTRDKHVRSRKLWVNEIAVQAVQATAELVADCLREILDRRELDIDPPPGVTARPKVSVRGNCVLEVRVLHEDIPHEMFAKIVGDQEIFELAELTQFFIKIDVEIVKDTVECGLVEEKCVCRKEAHKASRIRPEIR